MKRIESNDRREATPNRRQFNQLASAAMGAAALTPGIATARSSGDPSADGSQGSDDDDAPFELNYMLASCMFGYLYLGEILPEVRRGGATAIDLWPKVHGDQREQLTDLGEERFTQMLAKHDVSLGCITQYRLGPFRLQDEMRLAQRLGCKMMVTGGAGPRTKNGPELKRAVMSFVEKMKPHLEVAEETGVVIAIENHANNLIESPDSMKWLAELAPSKHLGIAFAPYHLPQDKEAIASLIGDLEGSIKLFYAWQHGKGSKKRLPKKEELMQLPGRGELDFGPLLAALKKIKFSGWTEIFMHPYPRGISMLETAKEITAEMNHSRAYLDRLISEI